ncbi:MAG: 1-phosphofructokinase family hexose kinase [Gemmatimonadota bacterium]
MILTVTPNPSIDLLHETDKLVWDDANRVAMPRRRIGGQGINLTRAARVLGGESVALAFFGGRTGAELAALLDDDGTRYISVPIEGETRTFVAVRETATGRSLLINPRGPELSEGDRVRLLRTIQSACEELKPEWLVCSGSIPRGVGNDLFALLSRIAHAHNARFIADCDGEPLERAVKAGCDLLAPNQHEAARLAAQPIVSVREAAAAARSLLAAAPRVLIKLGERGAVLADTHGCWHAHGPVNQRGSAVGAGDTFLAAFLVADGNGAPPHEALRRAVAAGTAVLACEGAELLSSEAWQAALSDVRVTPL